MKTLSAIAPLPVLFILLALFACQKLPHESPTLIGGWSLLKTEHWSNNKLIGLSEAEYNSCIYTFTADHLIISTDGTHEANTYQFINNQIIQPGSFAFTVDLITQTVLNLSKTVENVTMRYFFTKKI